MTALMWTFNLISWIVSVYMFLCIIRVLQSWIPSLDQSRFGLFMRRICDPYLDIFRNIKFLRIANLDFSSILALGVLVLVSGLFGQIASYGVLRFGYILASLLRIVWSAASSVITIFNIFVVIRLVMNLLNKDYDSNLCVSIDRIVNPVKNRIFSYLFHNRIFSFRITMLILLGIGIALQFAGSFVIGLIATLFVKLPF